MFGRRARVASVALGARLRGGGTKKAPLEARLTLSRAIEHNAKRVGGKTQRLTAQVRIRVAHRATPRSRI